MGQVSVVINNKSYRIACDDGQEAHLERLAAMVDKRVSELVQAVGQIGDTRLLVMASLLVADELTDAHADAEKLKRRARPATPPGPAVDAEVLAGSIEGLAARVEALAERIERRAD